MNLSEPEQIATLLTSAADDTSAQILRSAAVKPESGNETRTEFQARPIYQK
jgi:hypothetical protein